MNKYEEFKRFFFCEETQKITNFINKVCFELKLYSS